MALTRAPRRWPAGRRASASCRRPPGARTTCSSFEEPVTRVGEGGGRGGRLQGRPPAAHRRREPPRPRRAGRREGRGRRSTAGARHRPHPRRARRPTAGARPPVVVEIDAGRTLLDERGGPAPGGAAGAPPRSPTRTWTSATPTRSRRWSASSGRTSATRSRSSAKTKDLPPEARFRWEAEGLWAVESFLAQATETERRDFAEAVKRGDLELPANLTNVLTGLCHPEELARWTDASRRLKRRYGIETSPVAMHTDIPGLAWPTVHGARAGRRALLLERPELHAEPEARRRRPDRLDARGARRPPLLVGVALGPRAPADVGRRPRATPGSTAPTSAARRRRHARDPRLLRASSRERATRTRSSRCATRSAGTTGPWTRSCPSSWRAGTSATRRRVSSSTRRRASSRPSSGATGRRSPRSGAT